MYENHVSKKVPRSATITIPEIRNQNYNHRIKDHDLISIVQMRLQRQLIEVFKYLKEFTDESEIIRGLLDYDLNDRTRNNEAKSL